MNNALAAERHPLWVRSCGTLDDISFVSHGIRRCITPFNSGRHYLQFTDEVYNKPISHSNYFDSIKSSRRMLMVEAIEKQSYLNHCETLANSGINYLKQFPELNGYRVEAADGHYIKHACHTEKNDKGKIYSAGFIYALNLKNGLLRPLCVVTNGTKRSHEIPALRSYVEQNQNTKNKNLYVYDKAVIDFEWWDKQKKDQNYMISVLKENSTATFVESIKFDPKNGLNIGIEGYSVYQKGNIKFHIIEYRDPETGILHKFITTLEKSINPGTIAMLYFKRWTIEKSFNNSKSDLGEKKAWSSNMNALNSQMRFTSMAYNIVRVLE